MSEPSRANASPWRALFETVRDAVGTRRDEHGVLGSINWLRRQMEARGANPNVVRNIIYRDKGKLHDKRVLFEILGDLWSSVRDEPLRAPEIEVLLSPHASAEQEVLQLLGRDKRRAFRSFVRGVRDGEHPKLLVTGRPGSGKTMLVDYIQQALRVPPAQPLRVVRMEFGISDLATTLGQLGERIGVPREAMDARLSKVASAGAYAVQADAQADLVRTLLDALRSAEPPFVLLLHVSQPLAQQQTLGTVPLRLNTPDVPRVSGPEWLWATLLEPLSRLPSTSVLVSMTDLPARALQQASGYEAAVKLTPPSAGEARRFVKARLPHLPAGQQEEIVQRAGRSFEELRTLTLLAEIRAPLPEEDAAAASIAHLSELVIGSGEPRLRDFLAALATVSLPAFPTFRMRDLTALRPPEQGQPNELERAFVDVAPGGAEDEVRCFSRRLIRALRERLAEHDPARHRALHAAAAAQLADEAAGAPHGERAARHVHHLYEARDWEALITWMRQHGALPSLVRRAWETAGAELAPVDPSAHERLAEQVAGHYVKLGAFQHPDAQAAFDVLAASGDERRRAWSLLKQAEGSVLRGRHDEARALLDAWPEGDDPLLAAEAALVRASIARWRGELEEAARIVEHEARPRLAQLAGDDAAVRLARAKAAVWAGLIHKDRGDLEAAAREFDQAHADDDLIRARLAFQAADVAMSLGRYGAARDAFDDAVELAHRSGALGSEQARHHARRGILRLRLGDVAGAEADHREAHAILDAGGDDEAEGGFWRARVDVERAEAHLAVGRHDAAIELLDDAVARFDAYGDAHGVDAEYRIDHAVLHLGAAYVARAAGLPWRPPYPDRMEGAPVHPDARHALRLLTRVADRVPAGTEDGQVPDPLARRALLTVSLVADPDVAADALERALRLTRCPHARAEGAAHLAALALRSGDPDAAAPALERAWTIVRSIDDPVGDPGLRTWLHALGARTAAARGDVAAFQRALAGLLEDELPDALREEALRRVGDALERHERQAWLTGPGVPATFRIGATANLLRLGDRLAQRWREARPNAAVAEAPT
jgi:tetratricopeptide (TPR) repeat protein